MKRISEIIVCMCMTGVLSGAAQMAEVWNFDSLTRIAGHKVTAEGHPKVIGTGHGQAVQFNGVDDALFVDVHPLAGAETFTWEVIFRPDASGAHEQRFFHLQEAGSDNRMLFEIRVSGDNWYLDSFAKSGTESKALMDETKVHPVGRWYSAAAVYDGHELRNYVDGVLQGRGEVHLMPQRAGATSVGVRFNRVNYFKGAVRTARMTRGVLQPSEFLRAEQ